MYVFGRDDPCYVQLLSLLRREMIIMSGVGRSGYSGGAGGGTKLNIIQWLLPLARAQLNTVTH